MLQREDSLLKKKLGGQGNRALRHISLLESEQIGEEFDSQIHQGILQVDLEGNILYASKLMFEILGYSHAEVLGKRSSLFLRSENRSVVNKIISERKSGLSSKYEITVPAKNGELKHFVVSGTPYTNSKGEIIGSIGSFKQIRNVNTRRFLTTETEDRLIEISKTINLGFYIFSLETKEFQYLSPAFSDIYEVDVEEIYKENSIRKYVHPEDLTSVIGKNRANLSSGEIDVKYRIITPGGVIKWINDRGRLIKNEKGQVVKVIGYAQDVTGLKLAQEKLQNSEKEKENIINAIPDSFMIVNNRLEIIKSYFKPQEYSLLSVSHKFINNKRVENVFAHNIQSEITKGLKNVFLKGEALVLELEAVTPTSKKWYEFRVTLMNERTALATIRNITEQKSNILRIQRLFNITEQTQEIVVITDTEGRIEYVNPMFLNITGYEEKDIIGSSISILKSGKHREQFYKKMWDSLNKKNPYSAVFVNRKKNGKFFLEEKIITPFVNINGEITNFISSGRVIKRDTKKPNETNNKGSKQQKQRTISLIRNEENERKKYAKKIHEGLNQMLSAALMNLESLDTQNNFSAEEKAKIEFVNKMVTEIMQELRGVSANLSPIGLSEFGLYAIIKQLVNKLNINCINVKFILESNIAGLRFKNDIEINYYRIIQEAVQNILKHSGATMVEMELDYSNQELKLRIKDNGNGTDKKLLNKTKMKKYGILNIEERAISMNADLKIWTGVEKGFEIVLITKTKKINHD